MTDARAKRTDGVRALEDLRQRCRVDDLTGCWHWALAVATQGGCIVPMVHVSTGALGNDRKSNTMPAARAAWLLSGRRLPAGHVVWRQVCTADRCINPAHCLAGTRSEMHAAVAATGRNRGKPERAVVNAKSRLHMVKPAKVVRQAEQLFAAGRMQKEVRAQLGLSQKTASAIRRGLHPHSSGRQRVVRGASVFSLGCAL